MVKYYLIINDVFSFDTEKEYNIFTPIQNSLESPDVLKTIKQLSLLREKRLSEVNSQNISSVNLEGIIRFLTVKFTKF